MVEEREEDDARALVLANMRPPKLIAASRDRVGDQIVVFSHVEVWPWRVVLRGALANEEAATRASPR